MPPRDRNIGFKIERDAVTAGSSKRKPGARLVVIDPDANDRFVRKIFEAFADRDKKPGRDNAPTSSANHKRF